MAQPAQRQAAFAVGPTFSVDPDGVEMFSFTNDGSSIVGPRPATDQDRDAHAAAYKAFRNGPPPKADDVDVLLTEIAQLKVDIETRTTDLEGMTRERDGALAEVELLTTQRDELLERAAGAPKDDASNANKGAAKKSG